MHRSFLLSLALLAPLVPGCDTTEDDLRVAGDFHATAFVVTTGGTPTDILARGGSLDLTLGEPSAEDGRWGGTFRGRLVVPDLGGSGALDEVFSGTYTASDLFPAVLDASGLDAVLSFETTADVFVRDAQWELRADTLRTTFPEDRTADGLTVAIPRGR